MPSKRIAHDEKPSLSSLGWRSLWIPHSDNLRLVTNANAIFADRQSGNLKDALSIRLYCSATLLAGEQHIDVGECFSLTVNELTCD